jgi:hypothetical protein
LVGHLAPSKAAVRSKFPFQLRDLSGETWLEKVSFLELMSQSLFDSSRFDPVEVLNCLLSASKPLHQRVTFLIPPLLTELLIRSPELLRTELGHVVEFTLLMMSADGWDQSEPCAQYLETLLNEADPTEMIETILQISHRAGRVLPFEALIAQIFSRRVDLVLGQYVVSKLARWLVHRDTLCPEAARLFSMLCELETEKVRRYAARQGIQVRQHILTYLTPYLSQLSSPASPRRSSQPVLTHEPADSLAVMQQEMKLSKRCNFPRFLAATAAYSQGLSTDFLVQIIDFVGKLPESVIADSHDEFSQMCLAVFTSPEILSFLGDQWVRPERLVGLGRIVWPAPASLMEGSEKWLSILYAAFRDSIGTVRCEIVKIFKAIEEVTGSCVTDLAEVAEPYSSLITEMIMESSVEV